jgi:hypothetical protein
MIDVGVHELTQTPRAVVNADTSELRATEWDERLDRQIGVGTKLPFANDTWCTILLGQPLRSATSKPCLLIRIIAIAGMLRHKLNRRRKDSRAS